MRGSVFTLVMYRNSWRGAGLKLKFENGSAFHKMRPQDLLETALRVLTHKVGGSKPLAKDIRRLKQSALPEERELETDRLACQVVARELKKRQAKRVKT